MTCTAEIGFGDIENFGEYWKLMAARLREPDVLLTFAMARVTPRMAELAAERSVVWHLRKDGHMAIDPIPLALLNVPPFDPKMQLPVELHTSIVNSMAILGNALHFPPEAKYWEAGIIAAMALRSAAWITEHDCAPTLGELLPHATFSDDALKGWVMDVRKRHRFVEIDNLDTPRTRDPVSHRSTALLVSAKKPNQQAIEGCVFLQDDLGNTVTLVTQMKLRKVTGPSQAEEELLEVADFIAKTNAQTGDPAPWAALYCATGTTDNFQVPDKVKRRMRYIVLDRDGAMQLLSALGRTRLLRRISST